MSERQRLTADSGVALFVSGRPRTKGSMKPVIVRPAPGKVAVRLTESGEYSIAWKKTMIKAIKREAVCERYFGVVEISCFFRFEKLCLSDETLDWPTRVSGEFAHGDEDKLRRNVLDACTQSGLILDDSLSIGGQTCKRWCDPGEAPGVLLAVRPRSTVYVNAIEAMERRALS